MKDSKPLTLPRLRALARKHLGRGHSKLKKAELLAALAPWISSHKAAERKPEPTPGAGGPTKKRPAKASKTRSKPAAIAAPVEIITFPRRSSAREAPVAPARESAQRSNGAVSVGEPIAEGFFIARVAGEREARRRYLTEASAPAPSSDVAPADEGLGELPDGYGDDSLRAIARDPRSLFVAWDFQAKTIEQSAEGMVAPRAVLRVWEADALVREVEVPLEAHSFYVHNLPPGRPYRVELCWVAQDGSSRRIGRPSNEVALPGAAVLPFAQSSRFIQLPWEMSLRRFGELELEDIPSRQVSAEDAAKLWREIPKRSEVRRLPASDQNPWSPPPSGRP